MAVSTLMSLGTRAMSANYAALQTVSNNIANANTPGYSRQSADLETADGQFSGAGFFGRGVNVATVTRSHNEFLTREASTTRSIAAADAARSSQLQRLEAAFPTGEGGLGHAASLLFNSFVDVANNPQDASARQSVLARAQDVAAQFRSSADQIDALQTGVTYELKTAVASVNMLATQIAKLNQKIAATQGSGHTPNDLLDQRDTAINDLSQWVQVTSLPSGDGTTLVFIGGGQRLVLGGSAVPLETVPDPYDATRMLIGVKEIGGTRVVPGDLLSGGSISGLLRFQNADLVDARNMLGQMASAISTQVNQQQELGLDLRGSIGSKIFSEPSTTVLASASNRGGAKLALQSTDARLLQASDFELTANADGSTFHMTRLKNGVPDPEFAALDVPPTDAFGFSMTVTGTATPGDKFLLQPVGTAARNMQVALSNPLGVAAASPLTSVWGAANRGTAAVTAVTPNSSLLSPRLPATLVFQATPTAGQYSYRWEDGSGNRLAAPNDGDTLWKPGDSVTFVGNPDDGFEVQLSGVPVAEDTSAVPAVVGDRFTIAKTTYPAGNNGNANAMTALGTAAFMNLHTREDGSQVGESVTDAYAGMLANIGVRVQGAKGLSEQSATVASNAQTAQTSESGVNLDEEAARLIQFQQSYQAAAKMLQVAQSILDTLLQATNGR